MMTGTVFYPYSESREKRIAGIQRNRLLVMGVLTVMTLIEWSVICMSYYTSVPLWLIVANVFCVLINPFLIWWLGGLWWEQRKRNKEIERQYKKGGML